MAGLRHSSVSGIQGTVVRRGGVAAHLTDTADSGIVPSSSPSPTPGRARTLAGEIPRPALGDVIAGISVALVLIPQSLAYAEIAGVPPQGGLFAAALAPLLAAPVASAP